MCRSVEKGQPGEMIHEGAGGIDRAVNAAVRNGSDNLKAVDESLGKRGVQPAKGIDEGCHEGNIHSGGDAMN